MTASAISLFEIATAVREGRLVLGVAGEQWLTDLRMLPELHFEPVSAGIAQLAGSFDAAVGGGVVSPSRRCRARAGRS